MPTPKRPPKHDPQHDIKPVAGPVEEPTSPVEVDETDLGPPKGKRDPYRKCIATGASQAQSEMLRFVVSPDGEVTPDMAQRLPGRGAWVSAQRSAITSAVNKKAFNRAFKKQVSTSEALPDMVESLLNRRCLDLLGFIKRAGDLILGFEKVREEIRFAHPASLIEAHDGGADGRQKVLALTKALYIDEAPEEQPLLVGCFSASELGMALGRPRVIHAVVKRGRFAKNWRSEVHKLSGFRTLTPDGWAVAASE